MKFTTIWTMRAMPLRERLHRTAAHKAAARRAAVALGVDPATGKPPTQGAHR